MKSLKLATMLGTMGFCLAAGAASTDGRMFESRAEAEAFAAEARNAQIALDAKRQADFEAALPARLALTNSVIEQFKAEFPRDENGMKRMSQFALQVHATPSSVLNAARFARNVADFARQSEKLLAQPSNTKANLGDSVNLVFFPVGPCRIADSRFSTGGILTTGVARGYRNFSDVGQGGAAGCNIGTGFLSGTAGSIAMNIAATSISGTGNLNVRPVGSTTVTSSLNFQPGEDISNATVIKMTGGGAGAFDFQVLPTVNGPGTIHVIIDLLGFYTTSEPAPLECVDTAVNSVNSVTTGFKSVSPPACGTGFTQTGIFCSLSQTGGADLQSVGFGGGHACEWEQTTAVSRDFQAKGRCCRVPGNSTGRF